MFVITGATGHVGSAAAKALLAMGKQVRVVVRDAAKAAALNDLGAEVFVANLTDLAALARAVSGAEGVFLLSPPDPMDAKFIENRERLTQAQVGVFAEHAVPHVVLLSSVGAQHASGTGPIVSVHNAEQQLRASGLAATFVRAAYFVENWGAVLQAVKQDGALPTFIPAAKSIPMVSTEDIGKTVAGALVDGPRGVRVIELSGPEDISPNDVAATCARILGKPVRAVEAPLDAVVPTFKGFGLPLEQAQLYHEMYTGLARGLLAPESGERVRGSTSLETTLRGLLA